jgi:hypothetical protein
MNIAPKIHGAQGKQSADGRIASVPFVTLPSANFQNSLAIGDGAVSSGSNASIAIGQNSTASANGAISIGSKVDGSAGPSSSGTNSITIGSGAGSLTAPANTGSGAIAIGSSRGGGAGASVTSSICGIAIGEGATSISANYSIAIGRGTNASSLQSTVLGYSSSAYSGSDYSVVIGQSAYAYGTYSICLGNGATQTSPTGANNIVIGRAATIDSGSRSIALGFTTTILPSVSDAIAIGSYSYCGFSSSVAIGYFNGTAGRAETGASNSIAIGAYSKSEMSSELTWANGTWTGGAAAQAKISFLQMHVATTDATPTVIGLANGGPSNAPSARIVLTDDSTYLFDVDIVARNTTTDTESAVWNLKFGIRRGAGVATTTLIGTPTKTVYGMDTGTTSWDVSVTANTTNGRPDIYVTGEAAKTIRWVANARMTKVTG